MADYAINNPAHMIVHYADGTETIIESDDALTIVNEAWRVVDEYVSRGYTWVTRHSGSGIDTSVFRPGYEDSLEVRIIIRRGPWSKE